MRYIEQAVTSLHKKLARKLDAVVRSDFRSRPPHGLISARKEGRVGGRKQKLTDKQQQAVIKLVTSRQKTAAEVTRLFKIQRSTVTRLLDRKYEDYSSQPVTV